MRSCRDVTGAVASGELAEAGAFERLGIWFHLFMCRHCRRYAAQIDQLGCHARRRSEELAPLSDEARRAIVEKCACTDSGRKEPEA